MRRLRGAGSRRPDCGRNSGGVHGRCLRSVSDLPAPGLCVRIALAVRRFRGATGERPGGIFAERFGEDIVAPYARRTARLQNRGCKTGTAKHRPPSRAHRFAAALGRGLPAVC